MNNKGQITVFLCLLVCAMLMLFLNILNVINRLSAKEKAGIVVKSAISDVKAEYNTYVFDNYHILLFDKNRGGISEANLEKYIESDLRKKLGSKFEISSLAINSCNMIYADECKFFKDQIKEYVKYAALEKTGESLINKIGGASEMDNETAIEEIENVEAKEDGNDTIQAKDANLFNSKKNSENEENISAKAEVSGKDPRKVVKKIKAKGLLFIVKPEDMEISTEAIDLNTCISGELKKDMWQEILPQCNFDSCHELASEMKSQDGWSVDIDKNIYGTIYAMDVFNCANESVNDSTRLKYEMEYLVCGKGSDEKNLDSAINKIVMLRLPFNYAYLITDADKMRRVKTLAKEIAALTKIPSGICATLITGAWSYGEAIADARVLLHGGKIKLRKTKDTWNTDLGKLGESIYEGKGSEDGLSYKQYLAILLNKNMDMGFFRMLDLIQLNTCMQEEAFDIRNASVGFSLNCNLRYGSEQIYIKQEGGY